MIKFLLARSSAKQKGSRFPAPFLLRAGAEGTQRQRHCTNATPIFFPEKENGRRPSKRKAFPIASEQLEELQCLPIALPIARQSRVGCCYTIWLASTTRCRSASPVEVRGNLRLPRHYSMRRAPAMPHSASSLPPSKRHSRLTIVRRSCKRSRIAGIHGEAMYTALTLRSACSHSSCKLPMCGVKGQGPLPFSGGSKGGILFGKRIPPLFAPAACRRHLTFPFKGRKRRKAPCMNTFM